MQCDAIAVPAGELENGLDAALYQERGGHRSGQVCARARAIGDVDRVCQSLSGPALRRRSAAAKEGGGVISAVMTKWPLWSRV